MRQKAEMADSKRTPGPVVIVSREYVEALDRLEKSRSRLAEAKVGLEASERIERGCRERFLGTLEAYGVDDGGDPPATAREIWSRASAKPLTQREQRTLDRLQIKWHKGTITAEEKDLALSLSKRAWETSEDGRAAIGRATGKIT